MGLTNVPAMSRSDLISGVEGDSYPYSKQSPKLSYEVTQNMPLPDSVAGMPRAWSLTVAYELLS